MFSFFLKRKKKNIFHFEGLVTIYLYKCPICAFRAMGRTKGCGSDDFIRTAFLSVSPSIGHSTETTSLKISDVHLPEGEGGTAFRTTARIHPIQPLFKRKVHERSHLLDQKHVFDVAVWTSAIGSLASGSSSSRLSVQPGKKT